MTPPIPLEDAQANLLDLLQPRPATTVPVNEAVRPYLAAPMRARRTQPPADLSAMDGYAVAGTAPWRIVGESRCGEPFAGRIGAGEATRISTGAIVPDGGEAILLQEDAALSGSSLTARDAPSARTIRRRGFDFAEGDVLLEAGMRVNAAALALARSAGHATLEVVSAPRVAILEGGDELSADPASCAPHQIPASNAAMLHAMAASLPCAIRQDDPVPDRLDALTAAFERHADADLLVISGGASVGDHDLVRPALERVGASIAFWRVAMKPGKPLMVARRGAQVILGLPGNPVSTFVTGLHFMLPAIRRLAGAAAPISRALPLPLGCDLETGGPRREFLRARWTGEALMPLDEQDSSALAALACADALIDRPIHGERVPAGTLVPAYWIGNGGIT